jgi:hypothetical protein
MSETIKKPEPTTPQPGPDGTGVCLTDDEKPKAGTAPKPAPADDK